MADLDAVPAPRHAAVAIVTNPAQEVLLQLRDDISGIAHPGCWAFPGGGLEEGENARTALVRELHEETGLRVTHARRLFELMDGIDDGGSGNVLTVFHVHLPEPVQDLVIGEGQELRFFPLDETPPNVPRHVTQALSRFVDATEFSPG